MTTVEIRFITILTKLFNMNFDYTKRYKRMAPNTIHFRVQVSLKTNSLKKI